MRVLERPVTAPQQHEHRLRSDDHGQIERAVAIEVARGQPECRPTADGEIASQLERSIAVAQENRHALAAAHGQVRPAVAIEIAHDQSTRKRHGQWQRRTEGSVAVTQNHRDAVGRQLGRRHVGHPVAIEVADDNGESILAHGEVSAGREQRRLGRRVICEHHQER